MSAPTSAPAASGRLVCANDLLLVNAAHPLASPPLPRDLAVVSCGGPRTLLDARAGLYFNEANTIPGLIAHAR